MVVSEIIALGDGERRNGWSLLQSVSQPRTIVNYNRPCGRHFFYILIMDYATIKDQWSVFQGNHDGMPSFFRLNTGVESMIGDRAYSFRIGIAVPLKRPQENGLPSEEENVYVNQIEDEIFTFFDKELRGFVCVIIATGGMKEFMMYSKIENIEELIGELKSKFPEYDFQHYVVKDENWDGYKGFM